MHGGSFPQRAAFGEHARAYHRGPAVEVGTVPAVKRHREHAVAAFLGRLFIASIFAVSGAVKLAKPEETVAYMTGAGIPHADILVWVAAVAELAGAVSLALGLLARTGALGLIAFLVPTTILFHDFWNQSGIVMTTQLVNFAKNVAIIGGLMLIVAHGPGRWSLAVQLDPHRRRARDIDVRG